MSAGDLRKRMARKIGSLGDALPFGAAPMIILGLAIASAIWLAVHPIRRDPSTLRMWTFPLTHWEAYCKAVPSFEQAHPGVKVRVDIIKNIALRNRLQAALWCSADVPDLVEVENSYSGTFFRGPVEDVGFIDLTEHLVRDSLVDRGDLRNFEHPDPDHKARSRVVLNRMRMYMNRGRIFGIPHDVHPVMLAYHAEYFQQYGLDAAALDTWEKFIAAGREVRRQSNRTRYLIRLSDVGAHNYEMLLYQRDGNYFGPDGACIMDRPVNLRTLLWYIPLVAGGEKIAYDPGGGEQVFARSVVDGKFLCFVCPDWMSKVTERQVAGVAGRMRLMPLPAVAPGGRRTSVWGGTMLAITTRCRNRELAWAFAKHIYASPEMLAQNFRATNILPPFKDAWDHPAFDEPRAYWGGQRIGRLYLGLAEDVPVVYGSPFLQQAKDKMSNVIASCAAYYNDHGDDGFAAFAERELKAAAAYVRKQMQRNPF